MHKTTALSVFITFALLSNNVVAQQEKAEKRPKPRPEFSSLDSNGDNLLQWDEFSSISLPHGSVEEVFQSMDTDQDGVVSAEEYAAHKPPRKKPK
ncbi:EF-hand domain-containing protein [Rheinheimera sp. UJ51]|uniref:EF-hand domain-containing protein n=1 Tax=Rheinheimera sp. UJ51 TaxID=2892446 RepID=UPI001E391CE0|nr:EF-hand domain-containing protein [Rheinheimera sp. UJ51]MCC5450596.1 EF-hand domain-containing protein [Rheinheimera sp. UJ51]